MQQTTRRPNFQTTSWFYDVYQRGQLNLDPPYQRRSVWNQAFKDEFVDTILLGYPTPAIYLYLDIEPDGRSAYSVVDGKQRLITLFEFVTNKFPISEKAKAFNLQGYYFEQLHNDVKRDFWSYQFTVEYLTVNTEPTIKDIFDRLNRNVAKLTRQELRHARLDGDFIATAEQLTEWLDETMPRNVPKFTAQAKRQMKDVETVALLLLLIEQGVRSYSQNDLDIAFTIRDQSWEERNQVEDRFRSVTSVLRELFAHQNGMDLSATRLSNQADYYSLFGAIETLQVENNLPPVREMKERLVDFISRVGDVVEEEVNETTSEGDVNVRDYYQAARSASNDRGPRETRINIMKKVLSGNL